MGKVLITRDADYKGFNIEAEGGKFSVKNVMGGRMSVHGTYEEAKQEIDRITKARTKDQSAEQEVTELGKQMKKTTAKDAKYDRGRHGAITVSPYGKEYKAVSRGTGEVAWGKTAEEASNALAALIEKRLTSSTKDCSGTKDCGCGCTKDEMFTPYDSELKKHAAGAQARKVDAPKPKGRNIHIWLE